MTRAETFEVAPRSAQGFDLAAGDIIRVINTYGAQVVAAWAFLPDNMTEFMSMEHTRVQAKSSRPGRGTVFYSNFHQPVLEMTTDSSPGVHDWYLAACNQQRYERLGHDGKNSNCTDNLLDTLAKLGHSLAYVPCPLNLFENVSFLYGNPMEIKQPVAMPGDFDRLPAGHRSDQWPGPCA